MSCSAPWHYGQTWLELSLRRPIDTKRVQFDELLTCAFLLKSARAAEQGQIILRLQVAADAAAASS